MPFVYENMLNVAVRFQNCEALFHNFYLSTNESVQAYSILAYLLPLLLYSEYFSVEPWAICYRWHLYKCSYQPVLFCSDLHIVCLCFYVRNSSFFYRKTEVPGSDFIIDVAVRGGNLLKLFGSCRLLQEYSGSHKLSSSWTCARVPQFNLVDDC